MTDSEDHVPQEPEGGDHPSMPTEEYLLGGIDDGLIDDDAGTDAGSGSGRVEPPTEEAFAVEAELPESEDVPELDPVFRAALLESPESTATPTGQPGTVDTGEAYAGEVHPTEEGTAEHESPVTEEQTAILAAAAKSEVQEAIEAARRTGKPFDPVRPPASGDFEAPAKRPRYWWRFALATLIIVFSFAGATSASVLNVFDDLTARITDESYSQIPESILPDSNGGPQTIAIIGSDARTGGGADPGDPSRSDTTILMRLDPATDQIAMLSIPRDLKVEIPGYGTDKFNAAYSYGGTKLTLQTIKQLTGLQVNHVINVDFQGFASAVDAIGCVFVDVDREYYHSNEGVPPSEQYAEIDIGAGYQKLCGPDALEYARYRHTDTDLVRAARQQDLIGEVRNRLSFDEILKRRNELISAFTDNTRSDISGSKESLELLKLLFDSRNARVVEVKFPATLGPSYVTATQDEIDGAVNRFLGFEETAGPVGTLSEGAGNKKQKNTARKRADRAEQNQKATTTAPSKDSDNLTDAAQAGLDEAIAMDDEMRSDLFKVFYTKRLPSGSIYSDGSRTYYMRDPDKNSHAAYRMVMYIERDDGTHYFGLQGIRGWQDPPILEAPHDDVTMDGRDFRVYAEGDRIRLVSWFDGDNTYWVSNSLLLTLDNEQMLGMARASRAFSPNR
jgi:LCP family protein required for cell wall assembly